MVMKNNTPTPEEAQALEDLDRIRNHLLYARELSFDDEFERIIAAINQSKPMDDERMWALECFNNTFDEDPYNVVGELLNTATLKTIRATLSQPDEVGELVEALKDAKKCLGVIEMISETHEDAKSYAKMGSDEITEALSKHTETKDDE